MNKLLRPIRKSLFKKLLRQTSNLSYKKTILQKIPLSNFCVTYKELNHDIIKEQVSKIRNVAIIAHVDHGKTTLMDGLIEACGVQLTNERMMDSQALEQEKGITINSKVICLDYKGHTINIVDTPGHQDFGGEVERVLSMVDGVILLVCSTEGTKRQTKFVLKKSIQHKLKPLIVVNKIDRNSNKLDEIINGVENLICEVADDISYLENTFVYSSALQGFCYENIQDINNEEKKKSLNFILDKIIEDFECPKVQIDAPFQMLISQVERELHFGKLISGKILSGKINVKSPLYLYDLNGELIQEGKISLMRKRKGTNIEEINYGICGDIVTIGGFDKGMLNHILSNVKDPKIPEITKVDPPMMFVTITPNISPFAGKAQKNSLQDLLTRLEIEAEKDGALLLKQGKQNQLNLYGRGELHLGIILENMRREGFEMEVTAPEVIFRKNKKGILLEPVEKIKTEIPLQILSLVMDKINKRLGDIKQTIQQDNDMAQLIVEIPTRGLLGLQSEIMNDFSYEMKVESEFLGYQEHKGIMDVQRKNFLLAVSDGKVTQYGMKYLEKFGRFFIKPNDQVYEGQVIGFSNELEMLLNPCKQKELKNFRTKGHEENIRICEPRLFSIEEALTFIEDQELLEITPNSLRIRKKILNAKLRKREKKNSPN